MPGTNAGTGQPYWFRCRTCRNKYPAHAVRSSAEERKGAIDRVEFTGRAFAVRHGNGGSRVAFTRFEFKCLDCGTVGTSRHIDLHDKAVKRGLTCKCHGACSRRTRPGRGAP